MALLRNSRRLWTAARIAALSLLASPLFAAVGSWNGIAFTAWNGVAQTSWNGTGISCAAGGVLGDIWDVRFPNGSGTAVTAFNGPNATADGGWTTMDGFPAMSFNGSSQELVSDSAVTFGTNVISISFWFNGNPAQDVGLAYLVQSYVAASGFTDVFQLGFSDGFTSKLSCYSAGTTGYRQSDSFGAMPTNTPVHMLVVLDQAANSEAGVIKMFTNGVDAAAANIGSTKTGSANFAARVVNVMSLDGASGWNAGTVSRLKIMSGDRSGDVVNVMNSP